MTSEEFIQHVADRGAVPAGSAAKEITAVVLQALGERLSRLEAEAVAEDLPEGIGAALRDCVHGQDFEVGELFSRVARRTGMRLGVAVELTRAVLQTTAEALRGEVVARVRLELPADFGALLERPQEGAARGVHLVPERRTLAEGRPGSSRPLYSARADRVQSQSVAATDNPHGDDKLSSARGLTQEREAETLAEGRPGSTRPLSEGK